MTQLKITDDLDALLDVLPLGHGGKSSRGFTWDHDYHVRQRGYDCSSCHNFSRAERGLTMRYSSIKPATPGGPAAEPISDTAVTLVWADNSSTETGFRIERSLDGATFSEIGTVGANLTSPSDTGLTAGRSYYYRVLAYNTVGNSEYSMVGRATPVSTTPEPAPAAPTGLRATAGDARVSLSWNASTGATSYNVQRATTSGGPYTTQIIRIKSNPKLQSKIVNRKSKITSCLKHKLHVHAAAR